MPDTSLFDSEYSRLNPEQRLAVDSIEGPVMVIAGAGTGKTQTIALRIGKILQTTQINPSNILCLTFTESAATNMRQRLTNLIGSTAYGVRIGTFHAFCNSIITDHPEIFLTSKSDSVAISNIKQIQLIRTLIDQLPSTSTFKNIASPYYYQGDIIKNISTLKREAVAVEDFRKLINESAAFVAQASPLVEKLSILRATARAFTDINNLVTSLATSIPPSLYRSRLELISAQELTASEYKSVVKTFITQTADNLPKNQDLLTLYSAYQQQLGSLGLFDYDDMILWVINALNNNSLLLSELQERYQYVLIDEFQDTNSAQFEVINLLTSHDSQPNLFVVGDDDQSVYRFQGASVENIFRFYQKYQPHLAVIALKNNYRSHRLILETSQNVITKNLNRVTHFIPQLDKSPVSVQDFDPDPINLFTGRSPLDEAHFVVTKIQSLISSGVRPNEIAVLYRNNADKNDLLPLLGQQDIHYILGDSRDILDNIYLQQLITLFEYFTDPQDSTFARILCFSFLKVHPTHIFRYLRQGIVSKRIARIQRRLNRGLKKISTLLPDQFFNWVIRRFLFLKWVLKRADIDLLSQLNGLYSHLKSALNSDRISFTDWVLGLQILAENHQGLTVPPLLANEAGSIRLLTVHKAKGQEFEHVFLYQVTSGKWDNAATRQLIRLPLGIVKTESVLSVIDASLEEDRRLFYVALTRAKRQIYISYSQSSYSARPQIVSQFVNEIDPHLVESIATTPESEVDSLQAFYSPTTPTISSVGLTSYLQQFLSTKYKFNVTHLNSYHRCPLCFFFRTILRLPSPKTSSLSFGTAVHGALAYLTETYKSQNQLISLSRLQQIFTNNLARENLNAQDYKYLLTQGHQYLAGYYQHYHDEFNGHCLTEHDFKFYRVQLGDIPLTGKIDKLELLPDHKINVVDYKTGKPDSKSRELSPEGDYYRQLVFYKLLCDSAPGFPYQVTSGTIDFVQPNQAGQFVRKNYQLTSDMTAQLSADIQSVWKKIQSLEFPVGEKCDDPDHLHYLAGKYFGSHA